MSELDDFVSRHKPGSEETAIWANGTIPLRITAYLAAEQPPLDYVTSVRGLVFRQDRLVVVQDPTGFHIVPGGRCESGETPDETLQREVLEETGWCLARWSLLGFMHFHHLASKPQDYPYPYPDFLQLIYMAEATQHLPDAQVPSEWELGVTLHPIADVSALGLTPSQSFFLGAALAKRVAA